MFGCRRRQIVEGGKSPGRLVDPVPGGNITRHTHGHNTYHIDKRRVVPEFFLGDPESLYIIQKVA